MNCGQGITHNVLLTSFSRRCLQTLESPWTERWKRRSRSTDDVKLFAEEEDDCKEQRDKVWVKLRMHSWVYESRETWQRQKQTNESGNNPNLSFFRVIKVCSDQILFLMSSYFSSYCTQQCTHIWRRYPLRKQPHLHSYSVISVGLAVWVDRVSSPPISVQSISPFKSFHAFTSSSSRLVIATSVHWSLGNILHWFPMQSSGQNFTFKNIVKILTTDAAAVFLSTDGITAMLLLLDISIVLYSNSS